MVVELPYNPTAKMCDEVKGMLKTAPRNFEPLEFGAFIESMFNLRLVLNT